MKRNAFAWIFAISCLTGFAQSMLVVQAPETSGSTSAARGPNGTSAHAYMRGCFLVLAPELASIPANTNISAFGFTLNSSVAGSAVTGNFTLFLQNTTNNTYQKGTSWSGAITGMTQVYASVLTLPVSAATTSVMVTLSSPFNYTGGGLYVAYDWASGTPFSATAANFLCEHLALQMPGGGGASEASATAPPTTLLVSNLRPSFLFEIVNPYTNDVSVVGVAAPGRIAAQFNAPHQVSAFVVNSSSVTLSGISVSLAVSGANTFNNVVTIPSLGAGASTQVNFALFNPQNPGQNTLTVLAPADQNNTNNTRSYTQSVTCNEWSQEPAAGSFTTLSVGFNTGSGILGVQYLNPVSSTLTGVRVAISSNTASIGKSMYGALLSSTGATIATSTPVTITNTMLGTYVEFTFPQPPVLTANTTYFIGGAQTAGNPGWFPFGTRGSAYMPANLYSYTGLAGGALTQLTPNFGYFGITGIFDSGISLATTPQTITCGNAATLQAVSSTNYSWSTGAQTSTISAAPLTTSIYTVTATNTIGCSTSKTVQLTVDPIPVSIAASADTICLGSAVTLTASGASSYSWSVGGGFPVLVNSPQQSSVYTVTGSIPFGCTNTQTIAVAVQNFSMLGVSLPFQTICRGTSATITASGANSYIWDSGNGTVTTPVLVTSPSVSTIYTITGSDQLGCAMSRTAEIEVIVVPLTVTPDTAVCFGSSIKLLAAGALSYSWDNGYPFALLTINSVTASGAFTVTGTGQAGCKEKAVVNVTVNPTPTVTAEATRSVICVKEGNVLTAGGATSYSWSTGQQSQSVTITATTIAQRFYTVTGVAANGCSGKAIVTFTVSSCAGLHDYGQNGLQVFPNPSEGIFGIQMSDPSTGTLEVYNSAGQLIMRKNYEGATESLDLTGEPSGVYHLRVKGSDSSMWMCLIKQ